MSQLRRLFEIDRRIRQGRAPSLDELADACEVTRRQLLLDLAHLKNEWNAPIKNDRRKGGYIYTEPTWTMPVTLLREGELLALFLSIEIARSSGNAGLEAPLQSAVAKICQSLGDLVTIDLNALRSALSFSLPPAAHIDATHATTLAKAQAHRRKVRLTYFTASRNQTGERVVHPYRLLIELGEVLLIAFDENRQDLRTFNLARIRQLEELKDHFELSPNFNPETFRQTMLRAEAGQKVYQVALKFDEYQSRYIRERNYHPSEQKEEQPDGGLILRFPASGLAEVCRFTLGFGSHCQALEPIELREMVAEHVRKLNGVYGGNND